MAKNEKYIDIGSGVLVPARVLLNADGTPVVFPSGLGQATAAESVPVVQAIDSFATPVNEAISVTGTSTALIAAADETVRRRRTLLRNTGDRTVYLGFGAAATTAMFPLGVGESLPVDDLRAINGITTSGTGTVFVLSSERS